MTRQAFKIRERERVQASRAFGLRDSWTEFQIVKGGKIIARLGSKKAAEAELKRLERETNDTTRNARNPAP
jgi:hypothetical protein